MRRFLDMIVRFFARTTVRAFFRDVEVVGVERIPLDVPVVYVMNHFNSLVDPLLVLGFLPRRPRFLATSALWRNPFMVPFLKFGGVIPVYRQQDPDFDRMKNVETFAACFEVLGRGGAIGLFPEGMSHDEPDLQPMKTGVARIVFGAEKRHGALGTCIVPVGLNFDAKATFRSRVLIHVGIPVVPEQSGQAPDPEDREAVRALTQRVGTALETVTLTYPSWEEARLIDRAAELYARDDTVIPEKRSLAADFSLKKAFSTGYRKMKVAEPARVSIVARSVAAYDRMLRITSLRHEQVISRYPKAVVAVYVFRTFFLLLARLPLAAVGIVLNVVPYLLAKLAGYTTRQPRVRVSRAIYTGIVAFLLTWIIEALWAGSHWGTVWGWVVLFLAPLTGLSAARFLEQRQQFIDESRAYLVLRSRDEMKRELQVRREVVSREVVELAALYAELDETSAS